MIDSHRRSVVKAIFWRVVATFTTMGIVFILTRKFVLMIEVGLLDIIAKLLFYYLHERIWDKIAWGKAKHPLEVLAVKKELEPEDLDKVKEQLKSMGYIE
ncbi:MAG: DUF2061 domain-containing protein [Candidatus Omnitrophica bacterium]|nr:DUF2061 domain-containing protein [Candidatus Omnitrophota bacterium]